MQYMLIIVNAHYTHTHTLTQRYATQYAQPPLDDSQDITNPQASIENGLTTMTFTRPLAATEDTDISLTECRFFLYGWGGSAVIATKMVSYHPQTPIVSSKRVCFLPPTLCPGERMLGYSEITMILYILRLLDTSIHLSPHAYTPSPTHTHTLPPLTHTHPYSHPYIFSPPPPPTLTHTPLPIHTHTADRPELTTDLVGNTNEATTELTTVLPNLVGNPNGATTVTISLSVLVFAVLATIV